MPEPSLNPPEPGFPYGLNDEQREDIRNEAEDEEEPEETMSEFDLACMRECQACSIRHGCKGYTEKIYRCPPEDRDE